MKTMTLIVSIFSLNFALVAQAKVTDRFRCDAALVDMKGGGDTAKTVTIDLERRPFENDSQQGINVHNIKVEREISIERPDYDAALTFGFEYRFAQTGDASRGWVQGVMNTNIKYCNKEANGDKHCHSRGYQGGFHPLQWGIDRWPQARVENGAVTLGDYDVLGRNDEIIHPFHDITQENDIRNEVVGKFNVRCVHVATTTL